MITELENKNRGFIEKNAARTATMLKIKALFAAYGLGRSFIRFFTDEKGDIIICVQDNIAFLQINDNSFAQEAADFLSLIVNEIMTEEKLELSGFERFSGNIYSLKKWESVKLDDIREDIQSGYNVLSKVFTERINSMTYNRWYTDFSHRIRHNMSKVYTYEGACSATAYLFDRGTILITQLATLSSARNQGYAKKLLFHIASNTERARELLLLSQDEKSNSFYEKIGFAKIGEWHCYERN